MDEERIISILSDIEKYMNDLKEMNVNRLEDLDNIEKYYASSMVLFSLLNRVLDLGQEIVISKKLGMPSSYRDIFRILLSRKIIGSDLFKKMEAFVDLRNALSHEYHRIDKGLIFDAINGIDTVRKVVERLREEVD